MRRIAVGSTLSNQNISSALLVYTYTADADREVFFRLFAEQVAGNGVYTAYITIQRAGTGTVFEVQPRTAPTVASGITAIAFTTVAIPVLNTDVVKVYIIGLAGDTTTPDLFAEVWEADYARPTTQGQHNIDTDANGGVEVGAMQAGVITQAAVATGALDADALDPTFSAELIAALLVTSITGGSVQSALERANAYLNATIDSRAATGAAMDLINGAVDAGALDPTASAELIAALLVTLITGGSVQAALENALIAAVPGDEMDLIDNALDAGAVHPSGAAEIAAAVSSGIEVEVIFPQSVATMAAALVGDRLTLTADSDWVALIPVPGGINPDRLDSLFTVKTPNQVDTQAADSQSILQISEQSGLLYLQRTEVTGGDIAEGALTVVDELDDDGVGWFRLNLSSPMAAQFGKTSGYMWDYKELEVGADLQRVKGPFAVALSVGRTTSV